MAYRSPEEILSSEAFSNFGTELTAEESIQLQQQAQAPEDEGFNILDFGKDVAIDTGGTLATLALDTAELFKTSFNPEFRERANQLNAEGSSIGFFDFAAKKELARRNAELLAEYNTEERTIFNRDFTAPSQRFIQGNIDIDEGNYQKAAGEFLKGTLDVTSIVPIGTSVNVGKTAALQAGKGLFTSSAKETAKLTAKDRTKKAFKENIAVGGAFGGAESLSESLISGDNLVDTAKNTAFGTFVGGAFSAVLGGVASKSGSIISNYFNRSRTQREFELQAKAGEQTSVVEFLDIRNLNGNVRVDVPNVDSFSVKDKDGNILETNYKIANTGKGLHMSFSKNADENDIINATMQYLTVENPDIYFKNLDEIATILGKSMDQIDPILDAPKVMSRVLVDPEAQQLAPNLTKQLEGQGLKIENRDYSEGTKNIDILRGAEVQNKSNLDLSDVKVSAELSAKRVQSLKDERALLTSKNGKEIAKKSSEIEKNNDKIDKLEKEIEGIESNSKEIKQKEKEEKKLQKLEDKFQKNKDQNVSNKQSIIDIDKKKLSTGKINTRETNRRKKLSLQVKERTLNNEKITKKIKPIKKTVDDLQAKIDKRVDKKRSDIDDLKNKNKAIEKQVTALAEKDNISIEDFETRAKDEFVIDSEKEIRKNQREIDANEDKIAVLDKKELFAESLKISRKNQSLEAETEILIQNRDGVLDGSFVPDTIRRVREIDRQVGNQEGLTPQKTPESDAVAATPETTESVPETPESNPDAKTETTEAPRKPATKKTTKKASTKKSTSSSTFVPTSVQRVADANRERGLDIDDQDLSTKERRNISEEQGKVRDILNTDRERFMLILEGTEAPPSGSFLSTFGRIAQEIQPENNAELNRIINSKGVASEISETAQALAEQRGVNRFSPIAIANQIKKTREEGFKIKNGKTAKQAIKEDKKKIRDEVQKDIPDIEESKWQGFVEQLKCNK